MSNEINPEEKPDNNKFINSEENQDISFFYKIPLSKKTDIYEIISKKNVLGMYLLKNGTETTIKPKGDIFGDSYITIHRDPYKRGDMYIEGKGTSFVSNDGPVKRWQLFNDLYKEIKFMEKNGDFINNKGTKYGGTLILSKSSGAKKEVDIGNYKVSDPISEMDNILIEYDRIHNVAKQLTLNSKSIHMMGFIKDAKKCGEELSIPVTGLMGDDINDLSYDPKKDERREIGLLTLEKINDPISCKERWVLSLSLSEETVTTPEIIVSFIKQLNNFIKDHDIDIEGVIPEDNLIYDKKTKRCSIVVLEPKGNEKYLRSELPDALSGESITYGLLGKEYSATPSTLMYSSDGTFNASGISVDGMILKPKYNEEDKEAIMSVRHGSVFRNAHVEPCEEAKYAKFIFDASSPLNMGVPNVNDFFAGKEATMLVFKTPPKWMLPEYMKDSGLDKAKYWQFKLPLKGAYEVEEFFTDLYLKNKEGVSMPEEIRCDAVEINGKMEKIVISHDQLLKMFKNYENIRDNLLEEKGKAIREDIEFPEF